MLVPTVHDFWEAHSRRLNPFLWSHFSTAPEHLAFLHQTFSSGESCAWSCEKRKLLVAGGWWRVAGGGWNFPGKLLKPRRAEAVAVVHLELLQVD